MPDYHTYVVPVTVSIPAGESPIGDVAKYQATPVALTDGDRGPLLIDENGRLYVIIYGTPEIDHAKIKGVALKDPTTAESIPVSIESPAIAYDVSNDVFKVHAIVSGAAIDPRQIRALVSTDVVTVVQSTAASLKATVTQAAKDRTITGTVEVVQDTPADLTATVTQAAKDREISDITKTVSVASDEATASGNTEIITVTADKKLRIKTIDIWNNGTESLTVALRLTSTGTLTYKKKIADESGWILNLVGANWEGGTNEDLFINLSASGTVSYTIGYVEI